MAAPRHNKGAHAWQRRALRFNPQELGILAQSILKQVETHAAQITSLLPLATADAHQAINPLLADAEKGIADCKALYHKLLGFVEDEVKTLEGKAPAPEAPAPVMTPQGPIFPASPTPEPAPAAPEAPAFTLSVTPAVGGFSSTSSQFGSPLSVSAAPSSAEAAPVAPETPSAVSAPETEVLPLQTAPATGVPLVGVSLPADSVTREVTLEAASLLMRRSPRPWRQRLWPRYRAHMRLLLRHPRRPRKPQNLMWPSCRRRCSQRSHPHWSSPRQLTRLPLPALLQHLLRRRRNGNRHDGVGGHRRADGRLAGALRDAG